MTFLESDRMEGVPHPRETMRVLGHSSQKQAVLDAINQGQLHHAWLLGGPQGVGKATFAYRFAARLLAGEMPGGHVEALDLDPSHPANRKILAGSHPDLVILRRIIRKDGKALTTNIPVDLVRRALEVFNTTAAEGGWRICIIDSAEDLDAPSANALLKIIEEPPPRCLFLIVSHAPRRMLPTIRSRCRKLDFNPLAIPDVEAAMRHAGAAAVGEGDVAKAARMSDGSVGTGFMRLDPGSATLIEAVEARLAEMPRVDLMAVLALAEDVSARGHEDEMALMLDTVEAWLSRRIIHEAGNGAGKLVRLTDVWEKTRHEARDAESYNLDKKPLVIGLFQDMAAAMG